MVATTGYISGRENGNDAAFAVGILAAVAGAYVGIAGGFGSTTTAQQALIAAGAATSLAASAEGFAGNQALSEDLGYASIGIAVAGIFARSYVRPEGPTPRANTAEITQKLQVALDDYPQVSYSMAHTASPITNPVLDFLGKLWALPLSAINFVYGLANLPFGARWTIQYNAINFINVWGNIDEAFTLGNVTLNGRPGGSSAVSQEMLAYGDPSVMGGIHEMGHTFQDERTGVFKILFYLTAGRFGRISNPWEAAANVAARGYYSP